MVAGKIFSSWHSRNLMYRLQGIIESNSFFLNTSASIYHFDVVNIFKLDEVVCNIVY